VEGQLPNYKQVRYGKKTCYNILFMIIGFPSRKEIGPYFSMKISAPNSGKRRWKQTKEA